MNVSKIVIIGKTPPPIGGVTIHVERLIGLLAAEFSVYHIPPDPFSLLKASYLLLLSRGIVAHLHLSNPIARLLIAIFLKSFGAKVIITYHGKLGRFSPFLNLLDCLSVYCSDVPIVLNQASLDIARCFNHNSRLFSAFLPPFSSEHLPVAMVRLIAAARDRYDFLYCTNAFNVTFDRDGREIYGIIDLVHVFSVKENLALVVSDPSSQYFHYVTRELGALPSNVVFLKGAHSFFEVLKYCDAYIRNTTTDGDSLSIRESLYLGKPAYATSVIDRPLGVNLYDTLVELSAMVNSPPAPVSECNQRAESQCPGLLDLYRALYFS